MTHDTHNYTCLQHIPTHCHSLTIKCFMPCSHTAAHLPHPHLTPPSLSLPLNHSFCFTFLTLPHTHPSLTSAWSTPAIGSRDKKRNAFTLPIRRSCCKNSRTELNPYMYKLHSSEAYVCNYVKLHMDDCGRGPVHCMSIALQK